MKTKGLTIFMLLCTLMIFGKPVRASTDYLEMGIEIANSILEKAKGVYVSISEQINKFISDKLGKIAGDYMEMKKKLKKAERIKNRIEKTQKRIEKLEKKAQKAKKRAKALNKKMQKLKEKTAKLRQEYNKAKKAVEKKFEDIQQGVQDLKDKAGEVSDLIEKGKDAYSDIKNGVQDAKEMLDNAVSTAESIKNQADGMLKGLDENVNSIKNKVKSSVSDTLGKINLPQIMPAADNIEQLAEQTNISIENAAQADVDRVLQTTVSADEVMSMSEISDVEALLADEEIGQVNIQEQLQSINRSKIQNKEAAKPVLQDIKTQTSNARTKFEEVSQKLDSELATRELLEEATNE